MKNRGELTKINRLFVAIISLLGLTVAPSCGMYGCPSADYYTEGYVFDENDKPLSGIKMSYGNDVSKYDSVFSPVGIVYTDAKGKFSAHDYWDSDLGRSITIVAEDTTDVYESDTATHINMIRFKKSKGWYEGAYKATHNFHLKKKKK